MNLINRYLIYIIIVSSSIIFTAEDQHFHENWGMGYSDSHSKKFDIKGNYGNLFTSTINLLYDRLYHNKVQDIRNKTHDNKKFKKLVKKQKEKFKKLKQEERSCKHSEALISLILKQTKNHPEYETVSTEYSQFLFRINYNDITKLREQLENIPDDIKKILTNPETKKYKTDYSDHDITAFTSTINQLPKLIDMLVAKDYDPEYYAKMYRTLASQIHPDKIFQKTQSLTLRSIADEGFKAIKDPLTKNEPSDSFYENTAAIKDLERIAKETFFPEKEPSAFSMITQMLSPIASQVIVPIITHNISKHIIPDDSYTYADKKIVYSSQLNNHFFISSQHLDCKFRSLTLQSNLHNHTNTLHGNI